MNRDSRLEPRRGDVGGKLLAGRRDRFERVECQRVGISAARPEGLKKLDAPLAEVAAHI